MTYFREKCIFTILSVFLSLSFLGLIFGPDFFLKKTLAGNIQTSVIITVCGNGIPEVGEECDDGNISNNDSCLNTCKNAVCGDGYLWVGVEPCDDGNLISGDGCSAICQVEVPPPPPQPPGGGGGPVVIPTQVIIQGKAYPFAKITLLIDGKMSTIVSADKDANFKIEINSITPGIYTFGLWAEDRLGRKSITFSFTTNILAEKITTISGIFIPPTIELEKVNLLKAEPLNILGQTAPESLVIISVESPAGIINTSTAQDSGDWAHTFDTTPLEEGGHTTRAKAESKEGLLSSYSQVLGFYIGKYFKEEICPRADFNKDGRTNLTDFSILLFWWGKANPCVDQNRDGIVNLPDFSILLYWWTG